MTTTISPACLLLDALTAAGIRTACDFDPAGRGGYIADVDLTVGGPTIRARYESRWERLTLTASWGGDRLEVSCNDCPLIRWIEAAEEFDRI